MNVLRVYVAVPEVYTRAAQAGATASLTLDEYPGEHFTGKLVRNASSIDPASRTLLTEKPLPSAKPSATPSAPPEHPPTIEI
jgi:multidrug efflux pump subunit AcrA (membrane-fusion protein)